MTDWASANGERVVSGSLYVPRYGAWVVDFALALSAVIVDPIALTVGSLSLRGHVIRAGSYAGSRAYRVVGGAGGWSRNLAARSYVRAGGVTSDLVIGDLAKETGETLGVFAGAYLGRTYVRLAGPASRTLSALVRSWYVDYAGVTQVRERPSSAVRSEFVPTMRSGGAGIIQIATESPEEWTPGATFTSPLLNGSTQTVEAVRHHWRQDGYARLEVLTA